MAPGNPNGTIFGGYVNGIGVAPAVNAANVGPLVVLYIGPSAANSTIRIINESGHDVSLANVPPNLASTGHLILYRIADGGV